MINAKNYVYIIIYSLSIYYTLLINNYTFLLKIFHIIIIYIIYYYNIFYLKLFMYTK